MTGDDDSGSFTTPDSVAPTNSEQTTAEKTTAERGPLSPKRPERLSHRYRMTKEIGHGGQGEVVDAIDAHIGREVAIKRMRAETPSARQIERFLREAKLQARLDHPAIVPVYEIGFEDDGKPFFAMKKLAGTTLAKLLEEDAIPTSRLLRAFVDVCLAIELAHTRGVIHRDLKPENIMLGEFGETYVIDWGIAKLVDEEDLPADRRSDPALATVIGTMVGTRGFMAPEQERGSLDIDRRVDVYALGCVLFEILARTPLHTGNRETPKSAFDDADPHPALRAPEREIPPELDTLCARATARDRDQRIATARELADGVQRYLDGDRDLTVRRALATDHLRAATEAFAAGDRVTALREAARAIALDPRLDPAAELVTRVMMEPPANVPPEVEAALEEDADRTVKRAAKGIALTNLAYLFFAPLMILGDLHPAYLVILFGFVALKFVVIWGMSRWGAWLRWARLGLNLPILVILVRLTSPLLVAPAIAAITAIGLMSGTFRTRLGGAAVAVGLSLGVLLPWFAEALGWLSPTLSAGHGEVTLVTPILPGPPAVYLFTTVITTILVVVAISTSNGLRNAERTSRRQVRLQAWQLAQLVPR